MVKQNWKIDSNEKLRILSLHENATKKHYLISEQKSEQYTLDFGNTFTSGKYSFNPTYTRTVQENVLKIVNYIKNNNLKNFEIVITPGESQVPNQHPFETVGSLAQARGNVLKTYLENVLPNILGYRPEIKVNEPIIGDTPWNSKLGKDNTRYRQEQFIRVSIVLKPEEPKPIPYNRTANYGEGIYLNKGVSNYLIGYIKVPSVKTTNVSDSGLQNLSNQPVIFTEIKKDTVPTEVVGQYEIPWEWWNTGRDIPQTRNITEKDLEYIRTKTKKL